MHSQNLLKVFGPQRRELITYPKGSPESGPLHCPKGQRSLRMLVLSRQKDQTIMIGDDIEITIVDVRGDKVRIGIAAPSSIPVHRKEVYEAIKQENKQAANVRVEDITTPPKKGPN